MKQQTKEKGCYFKARLNILILKNRKLEKEYGLAPNYLYRWIRKYEKEGFEGLTSKSGKARYSNPHAGLHLRKPKNKIEELELELMKKEIEIARLKKGYMVKGVSAEKEFVTTFDKNIK